MVARPCLILPPPHNFLSCRWCSKQSTNLSPRQVHPLPRIYFQLRLIGPFRPQIMGSSSNNRGDSTGLRIFTVSDLHTDYSDNMAWVRALSMKKQQQGHENDVLIVAGDVAETCRNFGLTMSLLKESFHRVLYVPGNHDLWCRRENPTLVCDSFQKLDKLLDACQRIGVETKPLIVDDLGIIPLFSWYHESFDKEKDITGCRIPSLAMVIHFLFPSKSFAQRRECFSILSFLK